jgi:hypothetical protein
MRCCTQAHAAGSRLPRLKALGFETPVSVMHFSAVPFFEIFYDLVLVGNLLLMKTLQEISCN